MPPRLSIRTIDFLPRTFGSASPSSDGEARSLGEQAHSTGPAAPDDLTPREVEVLRQLALGRANKEIAHALSISEETVNSHVGNVLSKLHVENRSQAIVQALKRRLVKLEELS